MFNLLKSSILQIGLNIDDNLILKLLDYWNFLNIKNKYINLISRNNNNKFNIINHILDSVTLNLYNLPKYISYMDLGSGGGLPAIPLKILHSHWKTTLVEKIDKKAEFLKEAGVFLKFKDFYVRNINLTKFNLTNNFYNLITARGVTKLNKLIELIFIYLNHGGLFIAFKGPNFKEELKDINLLQKKYNIKLLDIKTIILPIINIERNLLLFYKY